MTPKEKIEYVKKVATEYNVDFDEAWSQYEFYEDDNNKEIKEDFKDFREYLEDYLKESIFDKKYGSTDLRDLFFEGGRGESIEDAVIIRGIINAKTLALSVVIYISEIYGKGTADWTSEYEDLLIEKDKVYQVITIKHPDDSLKTFYFDITEYCEFNL